MTAIITVAVLICINLIFLALSSFFSPVISDMLSSLTGLNLPAFPFPQRVIDVASFFFPLRTGYICIMAIVNAYSVKISMVAIKYFTKLI